MGKVNNTTYNQSQCVQCNG